MALPVYEDQASVSQMVCEKFFVYATNVMEEYPGLSKSLETRVNRAHDAVDQCILFLKGWMLSGHRETRREQAPVLFPKTPWQFFKQRHMPAWFVERFPVDYDKTYVTVAEHHHYICPHLVTDDRHNHIMFMYEGVNGKEKHAGSGTPGASS